jgi:hypothetical protein
MPMIDTEINPGDLIMLYNRTMGMIEAILDDGYCQIQWLTKDYNSVKVRTVAVQSWRHNYLYQKNTGGLYKNG